MKMILGLALVVMGIAAPVVAQGQVAVYVHTAHDPSGLTDEATTERLKAVADMKKRLAKNGDVRLVDTPDAARISVEVVNAGAEKGDNKTVTTTKVVAGVAITQGGDAMWDFVGRANITSGTFKTTIESSIGPFGRSYGENLGRKFDDWLKKNLKALQAQ